MKRFLLSLIRKLQKNAKLPSNRAKSFWLVCEKPQASYIHYDWIDEIETMDDNLIPDSFSLDAVITATFKTEKGEFLVQIFPDGQAHLAQRSERHDTWSPGWWSVASEHFDDEIL